MAETVQKHNLDLDNMENFEAGKDSFAFFDHFSNCLLYTSPSPRDGLLSRMPSSA